MSGIVGLLGFSYQRLLALRRCERWAAPYLARPLASVAPQPTSEGLEEATSELRWQLRQPSLVPRGCAKAAFWLGALAALMQAAKQLGLREDGIGNRNCRFHFELSITTVIPKNQVPARTRNRL